ncbi:GntR family transcriptional regulator [Fulvimarina sp. MAC8]|uniref:GntR family transcriptional regulator n=1 Tax=Fulvimarina sp. MAC8 TaxID=3162874 RepID=UPI0032F09CF2
MGRKRIMMGVAEGGEPIARVGLHDAACERLRCMIVTGELEPGERLGEKALSEHLNISRTPLRESFKLLAQEGLIDLVPNKGARVTPLCSSEVLDLFEAAAAIERSGAELAAKRMTAEELLGLDELQSKIEEEYAEGRRERYFALNQDIHRAILAGSRNSVLIRTHERMFPSLERARFHALNDADRWKGSVHEHRDILEALKGRDGDRAGRLLAHHVLETGRSVSRDLSECSEAA